MLSAVVAGAAALGLAGCGGSGGGGGGGDTPSPSVGDRLTMGIWAQEEMPYTMQDAKDKNWIEVGGADCDPNFGHRYRKSAERITPTIIYNNLGEIAGFQGVVNPSTFPLDKTNLKVGDVQNVGADEAGHTIFFKDPAQLCSARATVASGSSLSDRLRFSLGIPATLTLAQGGLARPEMQASADTFSLGDRLWLRECENCGGSGEKITYVNIPLDINKDAMPDGYTSGGCAPTGFLDPPNGPGNPSRFPKTPGMGTHWWKNMEGPLGKNVAMHDAGPMFFLYSGGKLRAMGFVYAGEDENIPTVGSVKPTRAPNGVSWYMNNTELWEFATQPLYPHFFAQEKMPVFLESLNTWNPSLPNGTVTTGTMHIHFSDHQTIECP